MASFVPTSAETLEDQRLYTTARLTEVACLDCLARVGVKKNSEHHTSIQWNDEALHQCPEFSRMDRRPEGRPGPRSLPATGGQHRRRPPARDRSRSVPRTATEVTGRVSYDLQVVGVVEETADAHSVSFGVPEGAEAEFDYKPGQFLTLAVPSDQTGVAARCYSLSSSPARRRAADRHRQADRRRLRVQLDLRQPRARDRRSGCCRPSGIFTPASLDADLLLFAGGSGITPIMSITRTALAHGSGRIMLFYANRDETVGHLRLRARARWPPSTRTGWSSCTGWSRCRGCPPRSR